MPPAAWSPARWRSRRPGWSSLSLEACLLEVDGEITDSAAEAAHGHPAQAGVAKTS